MAYSSYLFMKIYQRQTADLSNLYFERVWSEFRFQQFKARLNMNEQAISKALLMYFVLVIATTL